MVRTLNVRDHRRELLENRYVYAVVSRRARGLSIGVNMNPDKVCNFDCPYCQVDRTTPGGPSAVEVPVLAAELGTILDLVAAGELWNVPPFDTVLPGRRNVADIAFAGDGEPTTPREFPDAARAARDERDRRGLAFPLRLITNATMFHRESVRRALATSTSCGASWTRGRKRTSTSWTGRACPSRASSTTCASWPASGPSSSRACS